MKKITRDKNRDLAYCVYGRPNATPVFICHGLNSSRAEAKVYYDLMGDSTFRVIGIDRPGMGGSSFQKKRTILDFTNDIIALADKLDIDKFTIIGTSAGAAYALACAYKIPDRIYSCHLVSGLGKIEENFHNLSSNMRNFVALSNKYPWIVRPIFWMLMGRHAKKEHTLDKFLNNITHSLHQVDKDLLEKPNLKRLFSLSFTEAYLQGSKGAAYDSNLAYVKEWDFNLEDIKCEKMYLYNGEKDTSIPIEMGEHMHSCLENSRYKSYSDDGHLSTLVNQIVDIKRNIRTSAYYA